MNLPFTQDEFFQTFQRYNIFIWPFQYLLFFMAIVAITLAGKKTSYSGRMIALILAAFWVWMGTVYQITFFSTINKAAIIFGILFIIQGLLCFYVGTIRNKLSFEIRKDVRGITGIVFAVFALAVYPAIGYFAGHIYPASATFGLPCPTTLFTLALFLWTPERVSRYLLIIPVFWAIIGTSAAIFFGMTEDISLIIAVIILLLMPFGKKNRYMTKLPA